jgi:eukaryotic-like serine/threonine-protein kinase
MGPNSYGVSTLASEPTRVTEPIKFGNGFELDVRAYELRRSGKPLKLERIPMELLVLLVERRGELVTREQIIERIWGKDVFLDTDNSINAAVRKIRQVLKDDPERPQFVVTVTGKGYRFVAPVDDLGPASAPPLPTSPQQPLSSDSLLGKKVSHYRVIQMLGGGGMGVVYKAEDLKLGRPVALKLLPSELASDAIAFERLQREARTASALDHPNICSIYQLDEHEGQPFIVMQLLDGKTLREWIEGAELLSPAARLEQTLDLAVQVTHGLEAAHQKGIIHRDIKPANIFVTGRGQAKILDFGVAKFLEAEAPEPTAPGDSHLYGKSALSVDPHLTRTGVSVGTPSYLSPEQIRRQKIDVRTDLFSFGLVLYEMATGHRAFSGKTATEIRDAVLTLPAAPPRQVNPEIPPALEAIIRKSLEKDPGCRYQSAVEMRRDLEGVRDRSSSPKARKWRIWGVLAAAVIIGVAVWAVGRIPLRRAFFHGASNIQPAASVKPRRSVAVLGFNNLSANGQGAWLSTALAEMLISELAAGSQLRTIPGENVANLKMQFSLGDAEAYGKETLDRIHRTLGSDIVVLGSYVVVDEKGRDHIRLDVRVQDTAASETIATLTENGSVADLLELVSRTGARLRASLGVARVTPEEQLSLQAALPSTSEAARLYAEGVARMRVFDHLAAHDLLQRAIDADPLNAMAHSALADSWLALGYETRAAGEAKKAFDLSSNLSHADQLAVQGRYYDATKDWESAIRTYKMLTDLLPDDLEYGLCLARSQNLSGKQKDALATIDRLRALPPPMRDDARLDLIESNAALRLPDMPRALAAAERAVQKARANATPLVLARALKVKGDTINDGGGDAKLALAALQEASSLYQTSGDRGAVASILNNIGLVHYHNGNLTDAHRLFEESVSRCRAIGNASCAGYGLYNDAVLLYDQGDLEGARRLYEESLAAHEAAGNHAEIPAILNSIANVLADKGDQPGAKKMYERSLGECRTLDDKLNAAVALGNLGSLLADEGDLAGARSRYQEALDIKRPLGRPGSIAYTISSLGDLSLAQGDLAEARKLHQEALAIRTQIGQRSPAAEDRLALGWISLEEGNVGQATSEAQSALEEFHNEKRADNEAAAHTLLARVLLAEQKSADAQREIEAAQQLSATSDNHAVRLNVEITAARVQAAQGNLAIALKKIDAARSQAKKAGLASLQLEARLASAEIALNNNVQSARTALAALHRDAQKSGFGLIARKAAAALGRHAAS